MTTFFRSAVSMRIFRSERNIGQAAEDLIATDFLHCGGGKAANVAYGGQRLGAPVMLIGRVGDDDLAEQALDRLRQQQIDLSVSFGCRSTAGGFVTVVITPDGKKTMIAAHNASDVGVPQM
jgi:ribokinase